MSVKTTGQSWWQIWTCFSNSALDIVGNIVAVGANRNSSSSPNEYFDVQIQTTETDFIEVQVMVVENFLISNIFLEKKNAAQAIKVRNASYSLSAIIFYTNRHKLSFYKTWSWGI